MSDDVTKARTLRSQMYHAGSMVLLCPPILGSLDFDADLVSMDLQYPKYRLGEKSTLEHGQCLWLFETGPLNTNLDV